MWIVELLESLGSVQSVGWFGYVLFNIQLETYSCTKGRHYCRWKIRSLLDTYCLEGSIAYHTCIVCLFVRGFSFHSRIVHPYGDVIITGKLLPNFIYCDTEHPFIMLISEDVWHSHLLPNVWKWSSPTCFYDLGLSRLGFEHQTFRMGGGEHSNRLRHYSGQHTFIYMYFSRRRPQTNLIFFCLGLKWRNIIGWTVFYGCRR